MSNQKLTVVNVNRHGEVFDPSAVVIEPEKIAGLTAAIRELVKNGGVKA